MTSFNLSTGSRTKQLDLDAYKACLEDIGARLKRGALSEAEADAARLDLLTRPRTSNWRDADIVRTCPPAMIVAAAAFLIVAGLGAAATYVETGPETAGAAEMASASATDDETLANLKHYAGAIGASSTTASAVPGKDMPDLETMIARLAARLEVSPQDIDGWAMLGRSYFHTARYSQAAAAFGKAAALDPSSAELKALYEDAKAKASGSETAAVTPPDAGLGAHGAGATP